MPVYMLDTNIVSYFVRGDYPAVREHLLRTAPADLAVSCVTVAELRFWVESNPASGRIRTGVQDFLLRVPAMPGDSGAAQSCATARIELSRSGKVLSTEDLMIAPVIKSPV